MKNNIIKPNIVPKIPAVLNNIKYVFGGSDVAFHDSVMLHTKRGFIAVIRAINVPNKKNIKPIKFKFTPPNWYS
nr:hypothetical protein [Fervidicella metallireducens]